MYCLYHERLPGRLPAGKAAVLTHISDLLSAEQLVLALYKLLEFLSDVLLMDDQVVNQTIPIILCAEEDVEGNHGATIGQLDEETLFYMQSRGLPEKEIYALMERGRLASVISKIPDPDFRDELLQRSIPTIRSAATMYSSTTTTG